MFTYDHFEVGKNYGSDVFTVDRDRIVGAAEQALDAITEAAYATTKTDAVECWQVVLGTRFKG